MKFLDSRAGFKGSGPLRKHLLPAASSGTPSTFIQQEERRSAPAGEGAPLLAAPPAGRFWLQGIFKARLWLGQ